MRHYEKLQQELTESETALLHFFTVSSLQLVVVTVSASTSQQPPLEPPLVLTVNITAHETPFVTNAYALFVTTNI